MLKGGHRALFISRLHQRTAQIRFGARESWIQFHRGPELGHGIGIVLLVQVAAAHKEVKNGSIGDFRECLLDLRPGQPAPISSRGGFKNVHDLGQDIGRLDLVLRVGTLIPWLAEEDSWFPAR